MVAGGDLAGSHRLWGRAIDDAFAGSGCRPVCRRIDDGSRDSPHGSTGRVVANPAGRVTDDTGGRFGGHGARDAGRSLAVGAREPACRRYTGRLANPVVRARRP